MKTAVVEIKGKQFNVKERERRLVERLDEQVGENVCVDKILSIYDSESDIAFVGDPYVVDYAVSMRVVRHLRDTKVIVYKFRHKKHYRKKQGHRQNLTEVEFLKIEPVHDKISTEDE